MSFFNARLSWAPNQPVANPTRGRPAEPPVPQIVPVVLDARPGAPQAPAVRIFLGTQPEQYRAERIFFYSLQRVRDPERRYEVYRMTGLPGFRQRGWRTRFTNYRFAIPYLAGCHGKAIYTDVDQIFTADPAELFDQPMREHGYLALSPQDTAVMLLDCERMARCWTFAKACRKSKKALCAEAAAEPGRWGALDPAWHARDLEYRHGQSKLLHYTALHLQPWRPTPGQYSYHINPNAEHFLSLEQAADAEGYEIYSAAQPTPGFAAACAPRAEKAAVLAEAVCLQARGLGAESLALLGPWHEPEAPGLELVRWRPEQLRGEQLAPQDAVAACGLERLPVEDLPWVLERLFRLSHRMVFVKAELGPQGSMIDSPAGWRALLRRIALRYPGHSWQLDCRDREGKLLIYRADYARRREDDRLQPRVWVLAGKHPGDNAQLLQVADSLGWPYEIKPFGTRVRQLSAPWPDLVLSAGKRTASLSRAIRQRSSGFSRLVVLGRPCAPLSQFDLVVTTPQYGLPLRDNVVDLPAPFVTQRQPEPRELAAWKQRFAHLPRPWIALLVGGTSESYRLDAAAAEQLGLQASAAAKARGGSLLVTTSPRTSEAASDALLAAIDVPVWGYSFSSGEDNPYRVLLELADAFIVTGESISMLTEASLTGRPVALYPLPVRRPLPFKLLHAVEKRLGVVDRAAGSRGVPRQQHILGRLYDRVIEAGWFNRERRMEEVHLALGVSALPEGLDRLPELSPELLASSRARALREIRSVLTAERLIATL